MENYNTQIDDLPDEIWKDIKDFKGLYQVSNMGRIKSLPKWSGGGYITKERIIGTRIANHGYRVVTLRQGYIVCIHRLVCTHFLPNIENKPCINHKDGNRLNNLLTNLEWCTYSENNKHMYRSNGFKGAWFGKKGREHPNSKLIKQYDLDGNFIAEYGSIAEAARQINSTQSAISQAAIKGWKSRGFIWKYTQYENND